MKSRFSAIFENAIFQEVDATVSSLTWLTLYSSGLFDLDINITVSTSKIQALCLFAI